MIKYWLNLILLNKKLKLKHKCKLSKLEEPIINELNKNIINWNIYNLNYLFNNNNIWSFIADETFLVKNKNYKSYSIYFNIKRNFFSIDINNNIETFLNFNSVIYSNIENYIISLIYKKSKNNIKRKNSSIKISNNIFDKIEISTNWDINTKYKKLWIQCENCYGLNYKKLFRSKMNICEYCGYHLKMNSSDRIKLLIDPGTWKSMYEDMTSLDPIEFHSEEEPYIDRLTFYQNKTGLTEAVQIGIGKLNNITVAIGIMDFQFFGGSMGSVVGEKITLLIEYANNKSLPVIIVCASGGARMQEGSLSLMQMAKISSALYNYQLKKKLFYVSILTSPTTGGITASFGMLGDIIISEPNAYIAFAGKRVIEQTLNKKVPDGVQLAEYLFNKGLFDSIVPRNLLKGIINELFILHGFHKENHVI